MSKYGSFNINSNFATPNLQTTSKITNNLDESFNKNSFNDSNTYGIPSLNNK